MRIVLCAIAKNENSYINEWCHYYLNIGFNHIYIYDNNDSKTDYIGNYIDENILNNVTILPCKKKVIQAKVYSNFYKEHKTEFDWCAFFDVDEFLDLTEEFKNINQFLGQHKFNRFNQVRIKWRVFDDNDIIERNEKESVIKTFTRVAQKGFNNEAKSIIRSLKEDIEMPNENYASNLTTCIPSGKELKRNDFSIEPDLYKFETIFLNHYRTKSLAEFLKYKFFRGNKISKGADSSLMKYYWDINNKTKNKIEYIRNKYPEINEEGDK